MKVHNSGGSAKIQLRRMLATQVREPLRVLEFFGGPGMMRRDAWFDAELHESIDADPNSAATYLGDAIRTARHLDLRRFNVFDCDPFANPWEAVWLVGRTPRPPGERIAFAVTDGSGGGHVQKANTLSEYGWSRQIFDVLQMSPMDSPAPIRGQANFERLAIRLLTGLTGWELDWFATSWGGGPSGNKGGTFYGAAVLVTP